MATEITMCMDINRVSMGKIIKWWMFAKLTKEGMMIYIEMSEILSVNVNLLYFRSTSMHQKI